LRLEDRHSGVNLFLKRRLGTCGRHIGYERYKVTVQYEDPTYLEAVYAALFSLLQSAVFASGVKLVTSQRAVEIPDEVPIPNQPCLMQIQGPMRAEQKEFALAKWTLTAVAVIYMRADGASVGSQSPLPATVANYLIWGIKNVFDTQPPYEKQTLGGLVYHTWIEGEVLPEIQDQQIVITIPIFMLAGPVG